MVVGAGARRVGVFLPLAPLVDASFDISARVERSAVTFASLLACARWSCVCPRGCDEGVGVCVARCVICSLRRRANTSTCRLGQGEKIR
ncbi:hypothetical protein JB92DRAFT_2118307 [Gautieria morchelliformis]|nr:hypothetical protein JB92DRAFT_2118307 [Gautieria morchelliformis]